jgi:hypothetical protein
MWNVKTRCFWIMCDMSYFIVIQIYYLRDRIQIYDSYICLQLLLHMLIHKNFPVWSLYVVSKSKEKINDASSPDPPAWPALLRPKLARPVNQPSIKRNSKLLANFLPPPMAQICRKWASSLTSKQKKKLNQKKLSLLAIIFQRAPPNNLADSCRRRLRISWL